MRALIGTIAAFVFLAPAAAQAAIPCSDIPKAQHFIDNLRPGPNTRAAHRHLDAAKRATSESQCSAELSEVDKYARRSAAADKRLAASAGKRQAPASAGKRQAPARQCADALHQNRPGGSDYHGPPVAGCP